jgi:hypothetical protein
MRINNVKYDNLILFNFDTVFTIPQSILSQIQSLHKPYKEGQFYFEERVKDDASEYATVGFLNLKKKSKETFTFDLSYR